MISEIQHSAHLPWEPAVLNGKTVNGIYTKTLRYDKDNKRPIRLLLKIEAGAAYPVHHYPGGDDIFVLEGEVNYGTYVLKKDDYLFAPPDPALAVSSKTGCILIYALSR